MPDELKPCPKQCAAFPAKITPSPPKIYAPPSHPVGLKSWSRASDPRSPDAGPRRRSRGAGVLAWRGSGKRGGGAVSVSDYSQARLEHLASYGDEAAFVEICRRRDSREAKTRSDIGRGMFSALQGRNPS